MSATTSSPLTQQVDRTKGAAKPKIYAVAVPLGSEANITDTASDINTELAKLQQASGPEVRLFFYLQGAQEGNGSWASPWRDVTTALALVMFKMAGVSLDTTWNLYTTDGEYRGRGGMRAGLNHLRTAQERNNRRWGSDWFDHAQVLRILTELNNDSTSGPIFEGADTILDGAFDELERALENGFETDNHWTRRSEWHGAAIYAAAAIAFKNRDDVPHKDACMQRLLEYRLDNKAYAGVPAALFDESNPDQVNILPWHTAYAILAYKKDGIPPGHSKISDPIEWLLENRRKDDRSWGPNDRANRVDWTALVGRAICDSGSDKSESVKAWTIKWLHEAQGNLDSVLTMAGSIHAALFYASIRRLETESTVVKVPAPLLTQAHSTITQLVDKIREVSDQATAITEAAEKDRLELESERVTGRIVIAEYDAKIAKLENEKGALNRQKDVLDERQKNSFAITNKRALMISIVGAVILFIGGIMVSLVLAFHSGQTVVKNYYQQPLSPATAVPSSTAVPSATSTTTTK
jgi:hypothetical protein